jgi:thiamine-monophosphate kinase
MNEFELIRNLIPNLHQNSSVILGAGDDCAVLDLGIPDRLVLFKTDAVVEGVHFTRKTPPEKIGRKALARALSDIAAMAGRPTAALVTIGLPGSIEESLVHQIYEGINAIAKEFDVAVAGGETTTSPEAVFISISLIGTINRHRVIPRNGAQPGDAIFASGELGGSISGRHLDFTPRIKEACWLAENFSIHSMMDLSDGLAGDLRHILHGSKVGAELLASAIPISRAAKINARGESNAKSPLLAALTDGEDFELLFTVAPGNAVSVLDGWKTKFPGVKLSCIGRITASPGLRIRDKDGLRELHAHGYTHFENS